MGRNRSKAAGPEVDRGSGTRDRIDRTAYELFSRHGIRAVGVDAIVARSGVAKKTLYRHYSSKNDLVIAFLRRRDELWTQTWLKRRIEGLSSAPDAKLLAIFDAFQQWFRGPDFAGCPFLKAVLEHTDGGHPVRGAAVGHIDAVRTLIVQLAREAGIRDAEEFARQWQLIMMGSIIAAEAGNKRAAPQAKDLGRLLLASRGIGKKATNDNEQHP